MKITTVCCVCGSVIKVEFNDYGPGIKRTSHGYCSEACQKSRPIQIFIYDEKFKIVVPERGQVVYKKIYYKQEFVEAYLTLSQLPGCYGIERRVYDKICNAYEVKNTSKGHFYNKKDALHECRDWATKMGLPIIL